VLALSRRPTLARAALAALSWTPPLFSHLVGVSAGTRWFHGPPKGGPHEGTVAPTKSTPYI